MISPTCQVLVEAGRLSPGQTAGAYSYYPFCGRRIIIGDYTQLTYAKFAPDWVNTFAAQARCSILTRLAVAGFHMPMLYVTSRFRNAQQVEMARIVNGNQHIADADVPANRTETDCDWKFAAFAREYHKNSKILVFEVDKSVTERDADGSCYSPTTAVITVNVIEDLLIKQEMEGRWLAVTTPYVAQRNLVTAMLAKLKQDHATNERVASQFTAVKVATIDTMMGNEVIVNVVDLAGVIGFIREIPRTVIAFTRAKIGTIIVKGSFQTLPVKSRLVPLFYYLDKIKVNVHVYDGMFNSMTPFDNVLAAKGIAPIHQGPASSSRIEEHPIFPGYFWDHGAPGEDRHECGPPRAGLSYD